MTLKDKADEVLSVLPSVGFVLIGCRERKFPALAVDVSVPLVLTESSVKFSDGKGGSRRISSQRVPLTVWADATGGTNEAKPKTIIAISFMEQPVLLCSF